MAAISPADYFEGGGSTQRIAGFDGGSLDPEDCCCG
jgi:hypothetical protein